jgi:hypothetical protein
MMTLSVMTVNRMTLSIMTLSIATQSFLVLSIMTLSIKKLSIMTLRKCIFTRYNINDRIDTQHKGLNLKLSKNDTQQKRVPLCCVALLLLG